MSHPDPSPGSLVHQPSPKRRQILAGAREVFRETGFERTTVDQIAARAGVSKATVYNHFHDKKALYVAYLSEEVDALRDSVRCMLCLSEPSGEVAAALQAVGERLLTLFLDPTIVGFYRSASAELERFPELGQLLFDRGPAAMYAVLTDYLGRWVEHGALRIADLRTAAVHFVTLCHGDLVVRSQLGVLPEPRGPAIVATVRQAVAVFLAAYAA